jgi:hypothetical protein
MFCKPTIIRPDGRDGSDMKPVLILLLCGLTASLAGCRCAPGFNCYADFIDDLHDEQVMWDQWYLPRLDISRAGKPDWCGPVNSRLAPCRCCDTGCWDRADECWRYPSGYPYLYPSRTQTITQINGPAAPVYAPSTEAAAPATEVMPVPPAPGYEEPPVLLPPAPPPAPLP